MSPTHLLDTGWIVRHLRGSKAYTKTLLDIGAQNLAICIVSLAELYEGVYRAANPTAAEQAVLIFLSDKTILPITDDICRLFGQHRAWLRRRNLLIGDVDLLIASTYLYHGLTLLTTNRRHFQRLPELPVLSQPFSLR